PAPSSPAPAACAASIAPTRGSSCVERPVPMRTPMRLTILRPDKRSGGCSRGRAILPRVGPGVIAIFGPTGIGKTAVAVALAARLRAAAGEDPVAISADALQVYAGLELLTGVASTAEQAALEHRLVSFLPVDASFSAGQYAALAHAEIDGALAAGRRPLVVGGTGLYLRAALTELALKPPPPEGVRERWERELEARGAPALHAELARRAPWAAETIEPGDRQRIVRAHELLDAGELEPPEGPSQLWTDEVRHPTLLAGLTM